MEKNKQIVIVCENLSPGTRIDRFLSSYPEIGSRNRAAHLIERGLVKHNSNVAKASIKLKNSDVIEVTLPLEEKTALTADPTMSLEVLYEDKDLIVINKAAGIVVHPAAGHQGGTLVNAVMAHTKSLSMKFGENRPGVVHRLDKDTSGILVMAKNDLAHEALATQFREKTVHRKYFALSMNVPKWKIQKIESYLARHPTHRKMFASIMGHDGKILRQRLNPDPPVGKWSITNASVKQTLSNQLCYLSLVLETGRTHQIRVHLSELGFPIIGDPIYGTKSSARMSTEKAIPRLALHAGELSFTHPTSKKLLEFKIPWPENMRLALQSLGITEL